MNASSAFRIFVLLAAVLAPPLALADWTADEAEIRQALAKSVDGFNRGDLPGHLAIYDPGVTFMTKDGPRPGVAPIEQSFRERYFKDGKPPLSGWFTLVWQRTAAGWRAVHDHSS